MILQYLSRVENEKGEKIVIETVKDGVYSIAVHPHKIKVSFDKNGNRYVVEFARNNAQIYNMWLLNDEFKTLKRLI